MSKSERIVLSTVLCLAVALRFAYLDRGLPYQLNSDEYHHTNEAKRVLRGQAFEPGPLGLYPNFFATLIAAVHGPVSFTSVVLGKAFGFDGWSYWRSSTALFLTGRILSALFGVVGVAALYLWTRRELGPWVATVAAGLFSVDAVHVFESHRGMSDTTVVALSLVSPLLLLKYIDSGRWKWLLAGCFVAGAAFSTKYNAFGTLGAAGLVALLTPLRESAKNGIRRWLFPVACLGLGVSLGVLAGLPPLAASPVDSALGIVKFGRRAIPSASVPIIARQSLIESSFDHFGACVIGLGCAGMVLLTVKTYRKPWFWLTIGPVVPLVVLLVWIANTNFRYALPCFPLVYLLAGFALVRIAGMLPSRIGPLAVVAAVLALSAKQMADNVELLKLSAREDPRITATKWIEANLPSGSTLLMEAGGPFLDYVLPSGNIKTRSYTGAKRWYRLIWFSDPCRSGWSVFTSVDEIQVPDPLRVLMDSKVRYVIVTSETRDRFYTPWYERAVPAKCEQRQRYYAWLDRNATIIKRFEIEGADWKKLNTARPVEIREIMWDRVPQTEIDSIKGLP